MASAAAPQSPEENRAGPQQHESPLVGRINNLRDALKRSKNEEAQVRKRLHRAMKQKQRLVKKARQLSDKDLAEILVYRGANVNELLAEVRAEEAALDAGAAAAASAHEDDDASTIPPEE